MNNELKKLIQPYWVEGQQGVYIPLIDKVLLKDNIPAMPYHDFMKYAKNGVKIATKDELLQMYLQRDQINKILKEHNGDTLAFAWFGSSSKSDSDMELIVHLGSGLCNYTYMDYYYASRAVVNLKN
jgi:hypothetical protein